MRLTQKVKTPVEEDKENPDGKLNSNVLKINFDKHPRVFAPRLRK